MFKVLSSDRQQQQQQPGTWELVQNANFLAPSVTSTESETPAQLSGDSDAPSSLRTTSLRRFTLPSCYQVSRAFALLMTQKVALKGMS